MIVYEKEESFIMIAQHDHGHAAGELAAVWSEDLLIGKQRRDDLVYAAHQHDRSWIDLDGSPFWNDAKQRPYSFRDFPLQPRFPHYMQGVDEVQRQSEYSALLCSLLYTTLFERIKNEKATPYLNHEYARQTMLKTRLQIEDETELQHHLRVLLICDELSLFLCMEAPGTPTEQYELFPEGLHYPLDASDSGSGANSSSVANADVNFNKKRITWVDQEVVELSFFPFQKEVFLNIPYKKVDKSEIAHKGISKAYREAAPQTFSFTVKGEGRSPQ
ncbi:DUF3891 family protein [Paenibacillus agricola]|uniref:DUF3891 family protein n=1 Tax=Paenibacillus agricola TaxID=2716264 RepID=A0ABX0JBW4_9BACL|nr:DUF3891 family protein [Paenibacillus agricola]NHN32248.1 DUF3891 family protein [Paenibacillus agricola]